MGQLAVHDSSCGKGTATTQIVKTKKTIVYHIKDHKGANRTKLIKQGLQLHSSTDIGLKHTWRTQTGLDLNVRVAPTKNPT